MIIERRIKVTSVVTEQFKQNVIQEIQNNIKQIEAEISYIELSAKRTVTELTIKASPQAQAIKEQFEWEKKKREDAKIKLTEQMKKINGLEIDSEIVQGEVTGPVEIKPGDNWDEVNNKEIVLKDGIIIELR